MKIVRAKDGDAREFVKKYKTIVSRIATQVWVVPDYEQYNNPMSEAKSLRGVWDTGATTTCISAELADEIGLIRKGRATMSTANGDIRVNRYYADIIIPSGLVMPEIEIADANLPKGIDVLIGMDIIATGEFNISCKGGFTTFSYSREITDWQQ